MTKNSTNGGFDLEDYRQFKAQFNAFAAQTIQALTAIEGVAKTKLNTSIFDAPPVSATERNRKMFAESQKKPIKEKTILWDSQFGSGLSCSPYAMFSEMIRMDEYRDYKHFWVINDRDELQRQKERWKDYPSVQYVSQGEPAYFEMLATASHLVTNVSFPAFFSKRVGQIAVNTWHSVTVKTLGYDQPGGIVEGRNILRSLLATDFLLTPNDFMTGIYRNSYKLDHIFPGEIIQTGFPRCDLTLRTSRKDVVKILADRGIPVDSRKIILFAPTWRGDTLKNIDVSGNGIKEIIDAVKEHVDSTKYQLLVRPHIVTYRAMQKAGMDVSSYIPPTVDANELLAGVEVLITDYSSIIYDFLPTGKQILFYVPDQKKYAKERGIVLEKEDLPGPSSTDPVKIAKWVGNKKVIEKYSEVYAKLRASHCAWDDGKASARAINYIFGDKSMGNPAIAGAPLAVQGTSSPEKLKVFIYGGTFQMNGVTTSLISKLKYLDYSKVDVTLYVPEPDEPIKWKALSWVPKEVRILVRLDTMAGTELEKVKASSFIAGKLTQDAYEDEDLQAFYLREARRIAGDAKFDCVIDYSGYSVYWPAIFAKFDARKRVVWQHSDLSQEFGNSAKRATITSVQSVPTVGIMAAIYAYFDEIVSCSDAVLVHNRAAMETSRTRGRFSCIPNVVDIERIEMGMKNRYCFPRAKNDPYVNPDKVLRIDNSVMRNSGDYVYADVTPTNKSGWKALRTEVPLPRKGNINFVSMGRLSSEKNQSSLITAFAEFARETPRSALYLIGEGAMRPALTKMIADLKLQNRVFLTGVLKNPFGLAALCDCFVFPSLYEGQGLVAMEAHAMHLPLIVSNFGAVESVCIPDGQLVVEGTPQGLLQGLRAYRDGGVPFRPDYDVSTYNEAGIVGFNRLIGL